MSIQLNHTILASRDRHASAAFLAELFGRPQPTTWGPFCTVVLSDGAHIHYAQPLVAEIQFQHLALLVDDQTFDHIYGRMLSCGLEHWADPQGQLAGQINTHHGGRGVYFRDLAGHGLELLTRPDELYL